MKARLQWGFKIIEQELQKKEAAGEIEKQKIVVVDKGMLKDGILDQAKAAVDKFELPKLELPRFDE
jgi:hypothetical protein